MNDLHYFKVAREVSFESDYSGGGRPRIGCIVVYKGAILAKGYNTDKTHTAQAQYNKWRYKKTDGRYLPDKCHAEVACIFKIQYLDIDMSRVHVFIYRETRNGALAMARPCNACLHAIKDMGIKNIHYTTDSGYAYEKII